jgi:ubiquinone/menaquinone biosynthesis C-methylase UbiE
MDAMTKVSPSSHDYLPAAGHDYLLPFYDLLSKLTGLRRLHRTLIDNAGLSSGQRVLEIGCGTGNLSVAAKQAVPGIALTAIDPDPLALRRARRKSAEIAFEQAYAEQLPYADGSFDRVLSSLMLHHLDDDLKAAALAEVLRVTAPGGSLHIADLTGHGHGVLSHGATRAQIASDLPGMLSAAGFAAVESLSQQSTLLGTIGFWKATAGPTEHVA